MVKVMEQESVIKNLRKVLKNMPNDWLNLTTHRLDIYNESLAKTQFIMMRTKFQ